MNAATKSKSVRETRQELQERLSLAESLLDTLQSQSLNAKKNTADIETALNNIKTYQKDIDDFYKKLFEEGEDHSIRTDIEISQNRADDVYNQVIKLERQLFGYTKTEKIQIAEDEALTLPVEQVFREKDAIYKKIKKPVIGIQQEITEYRDNISNVVEKYKQELDDLINNNEASFSSTISDYNNQFQSLKNEIESFMPGAMSAGLSAAYNTAKKEHEKREEFWRWIGISALGGILIVSIVMSLCILPPTKDFLDLIKNFFRVTFFDVPFIWLAIIANKQLKDENRLREEYLHKWAVAFSYIGLRQEAEILDGGDEKRALSKDLLSKVIRAYAENPSHLTDQSQSDLPIAEWIDKLIKKNLATKEKNEAE